MRQSHYDPDTLKSTYRDNYKAYRCELAKYDNKYAYTPNTGKFYGETEYKQSYTKNEIEATPPVHCVGQYQPSRGKFEGNSTYRD